MCSITNYIHTNNINQRWKIKEINLSLIIAYYYENN